jgi:DNA-binding LacI/PurR family transcriptional regulator
MRSDDHAVKESRHVTMDDVAVEAGVSRALVSLVMRNSPKVSEERRRRVVEAAVRLGYRPNAMARGLASRRTRTVGVLLHELHNPFYAEIMDGIDQAAAELDHRVLIATAGARQGGEGRAIDAFLEYRVDGLVLVGTRLPAAEIVRAARLTPTVVVARTVRSPHVATVSNDEPAGCRLAVQHLVELGHRRIAHIDGGRGAGAAARRAGYARAMRELGLGAEIRVVKGDYTDIAGVRAAERLLADATLPTAIFAANDIAAAGAIDRLEDAGLRIPDDVSVVGYDNTFLAALHHVSLTTVNQPRPEMGRLALRALVEQVDSGGTGAVRVRLAPHLVVRSTTAPPRSG